MLQPKKISRYFIILGGILLFAVAIITAQSILLGPIRFLPGGQSYTHYNNYLIFKDSFFHLIEKKDLYQLFPSEEFDYYKYSPSFALAMFPLAYLPDGIGLFIWNFLNSFVLFLAIYKLPAQTEKRKLWMFLFVLIELITSLQNSQSNGLIAGLILLAFILQERKRTALATLCIVLTVFIKLFGLAALALFLLYPNKKKSVLYTAGWFVLIGLLPLLVIPFSQLSFLYKSWFQLLGNDHHASYGLSFAGCVHSWFGVENKNAFVLVGVLIFCLPLLVKQKIFRSLQFRLYAVASLLIWIVIFNHKAESPTFIIAVTGISIWFFSQPLKTGNLILMILTLLFTILSPTSLFPESIRDHFVIPYTLKVVPCILVWFKITYDLIRLTPEEEIVELKEEEYFPENSLL